jgi:hypothetical protein
MNFPSTKLIFFKPFFVVSFFAFVFLSSCKTPTGTNENQQFKVQPLITGPVDFNLLSEFVLTPYCIRCHKWAQNEEGLQKYVIPGRPESSELFLTVANGSMPESGPILTKAQQSLISRYIKGLNPQRPRPVEPKLEPTWFSLSFHLFEKSCLKCHDGGPKSKYPNLSLKDEVLAEADNIYDQMFNGFMPPLDNNGNPRAPIPSNEVLEIYSKWIQANFP